MKRAFLVAVLALMAVVFLWAQRARTADYPAYEVRSVFPRETLPAQYQQVDPRELQLIAEQGWELVSVVPYIYKNEERGSAAIAPRPMATQTYPAYFFKRLKTNR